MRVAAALAAPGGAVAGTQSQDRFSWAGPAIIGAKLSNEEESISEGLSGSELAVASPRARDGTTLPGWLAAR